MIPKVHAIQTGTVRIRPKQMAATSRGVKRLVDVLLDDEIGPVLRSMGWEWPIFVMSS
jgi:hypothetical protein